MKTHLLRIQLSTFRIVVVCVLMAMTCAFSSWVQRGVIYPFIFADENGQVSSKSREVKQKRELLKYALAALHGKNPRVREEAINALKDFADPHLVMVGIIALEDSAPNVRRAAIELLTILNDPIACESIKRLLNDKDASVRVAAVGALAGQELRGPLTLVFYCGRGTMTRLYYPAAVPELVRLLESDPSLRVREEVAGYLWRFRDKRVIKPLIRVLEGNSIDGLWLRREAADSLLYLTGKAIAFGQDVRSRAWDSQEELSDKLYDPESIARVIEEWKPWWEQNADKFEWDSIPEYKPHLAKDDAILFAPRCFRIEANPMSIAAGDLNGDGLQDIAALTIDDNDNERVFALLGKHDGTLTTPVSIAGPFLSWRFWVQRALSVEDFNGDGILDILASGGAEKISLRLLTRGKQNEIVQIKRVDLDIDTGTSPTLATGDFNDDAILDMAISESNSSTIDLLLSRKDEPLSERQSWTAEEEPSEIIAGDINGDKRADLVVTFWKKIALLLGQGNGTFKARKYLTVSHGIECILLTNFDGDAIPDLVIATGDEPSEVRSGKLLVFKGRGDGTFKKVAEVVIGPNSSSLVSGDFNGDGNTDIAILYMEIGNVGGLGDMFSLILGKGNGTFEQPVEFGVERHSANLIDIASGDINGDGVDDIIVASFKDHSLYLFQGRKSLKEK